MPPPRAERPVGELVHELIEDGKAYARAEVGVVKAIARARGNALALPAGLFLRPLSCFRPPSSCSLSRCSERSCRCSALSVRASPPSLCSRRRLRPGLVWRPAAEDDL